MEVNRVKLYIDDERAIFGCRSSVETSAQSYLDCCVLDGILSCIMVQGRTSCVGQ